MWGGVILLALIILTAIFSIWWSVANDIPNRIEAKCRELKGFPPLDTSVKLDSTNLPIIFVQTERVRQDRRVSALMKIVDNAAGYNYGDTIAHPCQHVDYDGYISIKYRGHASFYNADKKSYSIRPTDSPLEEGGKKIKAKLLGMKKGKKYVLLAQQIDRSMMREALAYELARPFMGYVPQIRFCELIVNGVYQGVYTLSEQPSSNRLKLDRPKKDAGKRPSGLLLYFAREVEADINQRITIVRRDGGTDTLTASFEIKHPDMDDVTPAVLGEIGKKLDNVCLALADTASDRYRQLIDELSFIDYQLSSEFTKNTDAYWGSAYLYRRAHPTDTLFRMCLWDVDHSFGMTKVPDYAEYDNWIYLWGGDTPSMHVRQWWKWLNQNPHYTKRLRERWAEYRSGVYSRRHIEHVIDSLSSLLTTAGAMERNTQAWSTWTSEGSAPNLYHVKYLSDSFTDELRYIRDWIDKRLEWMDSQLKTCDE